MAAAETESFPLAPMAPLFRWLTAGLLAIPPFFVAFGLLTQATLLAPLGAAVAALYAWIWLRWRPSELRVSAEGLEIRFPWHRRRVAARDVASARVLGRQAFQEEFGLALRVGVGGLWGGFGWLWTARRGFVEFYVSALDGFVLVERRSGRPLLVTPERPEDFVDALSGAL